MSATISAMRPTKLLILAGSLVWILAGIGVARTATILDTTTLALLGTWLAFGLAFLSSLLAVRIDFRLALCLQAVAAVVLTWHSDRVAFGPALLVVVAGQLAAVFSFRTCLLWIAAQTVVAFVPGVRSTPVWSLAASGVAYVAFELFALGAASLAESERLARQQLARAHGRLEAMQAHLRITAREAERLRIARELHDSLGHQLTALGLDLEIARHLATGDAVVPVKRARAHASALLSSLREAVTELREDSRFDLAAGLNGLARPTGALRVEVHADRAGEHCRHEIGLALLRVAQEIVTNAAKHANASVVRLALRASPGTWTLEGRDDGVGCARVCAGFGLSTMRERLEHLGGALDIATSPGRGFAVTATVPREAGP